MKFQKFEPFEVHFKESFPEHLAPIYVVLSPKEQERKKILSTLSKRLQPRTDFKKCTTLLEALEHLSSRSLFSEKTAAVFDEVESLLKEEMEHLKRYVEKPSSGGYLLLGSSNSKPITELYKIGKKEMVILDLSSEKPWEEKQRIQTWALQMILANKKQIAPDVLHLFLEQLPLDRLLLGQELEKLFCYIGSREKIEKQDVEAIATVSIEQSVFKVSESIVFGSLMVVPPFNDLSTLLPLVGALRRNFEMGLKTSALLKKGARKEEIGKAFPRLFPKALQTCIDGATRKKEDFFKRGLLALFDFEFGLKTSASKPGVLFAKFLVEIL